MNQPKTTGNYIKWGGESKQKTCVQVHIFLLVEICAQQHQSVVLAEAKHSQLSTWQLLGFLLVVALSLHPPSCLTSLHIRQLMKDNQSSEAFLVLPLGPILAYGFAGPVHS
jgi:hypothetical protein